jgi:hypothetical protein
VTSVINPQWSAHPPDSVTVVFTLVYIYPINDLLMTQAGATSDAGIIRRKFKPR